MKARAQHPLEALPVALEQARARALPGREAATVNAVLWELHDLLLRDAESEPPSARVVPFRR